MSVNTTRDIFFQTIYELVKSEEDIVIVSADLGAPSLDSFREEFPNRFINVGIAEQNLISVSCGLALAGKKVIAYAANPFPIFRSYDQIRNAVILMNLPITIVGLGTGFSVSECGATHFAIEDISIMRTLPNISIISVSDDIIAKEAALNTVSISKPRYLRFDRLVKNGLYDNHKNIDFMKGFEVIKPGNKIVALTEGFIGSIVKELLSQNPETMDEIAVIDVFSLPFNETLMLEELEGYDKIITLEEHILNGGLGSSIIELLNDHLITKKVKRIGINLDEGYPRVYGDREYLMNCYGLCINKIKESILTVLKS